MIIPLQLLGPAIGFSSDPSSSKGKNNELSHNDKQMSLLDVDVVFAKKKVKINHPLLE